MLAAEQELAVAHTMTMPSQCSQLLLLPPILLLLLLATTAHTIILEQHPITLAGCPEKCGDISIPYPFGIKDGCFRDDRFQVICNHSFNPPRAFLPRDSAYHEISEENYSTNTTVSSSAPFSRPRDGFAPVELVDISASKSEFRVYGGISSDCIDPGTEFDHRVKEQGTQLGPFPFSEDGTLRNFGPENTTTFRLSLQHNVLIGVGRTVKATFSGSLSAKFDPGLLACFSFAMIDSHTNGLCQGEGCCQASFPPDANVTFLDDMFKEDMFGHLVLANKHPRGVPVVLDFAIRNRSCPAEGQQLPQDYACISENSYCAKPPMGDGYVCRCWDNYDGNPYITNGCQDINECDHHHLNNCSSGSICKNTLGGYECPCISGMRGDGKEGICTEILPLPAKVALGKHYFVGGV